MAESSNWQLLPLTCLCLTALASSVHAKDIHTWSRQLKSDPDFKVRLSAGLRLGQLGDRRAVPTLTDALTDKVATVRTIAASALAKVIDKQVPKTQRARALAALKRQMKEDSDGNARNAAKTAIAAIEFIERIARPRKTKNGVFVLVEPFSDTTTSFDNAALTSLTAAGQDALLAAGPSFMVEWPGGKPPTRKQLAKAEARAVIVMGTVTGMVVTNNGKRAQIECKLNLILASYPQRAARTFIDGKAKLTTGNRPRSIERAKTRCAMDIVKHLMGNRLARDVSTTAR